MPKGAKSKSTEAMHMQTVAMALKKARSNNKRGGKGDARYRKAG